MQWPACKPVLHMVSCFGHVGPWVYARPGMDQDQDFSHVCYFFVYFLTLPYTSVDSYIYIYISVYLQKFMFGVDAGIILVPLWDDCGGSFRAHLGYDWDHFRVTQW